MASSNFARTLGPTLTLAALLIAVPIVGGDFIGYQIGLYLLYGLATQGVALTWGRVGFLALGQALFFGMGAYISGIVLKLAATDAAWWFGWPLALICPTLFAYVLGRLLFSRRSESGAFFSLITLALVMLGFQLCNQWRGVTGGFNGLSDIPDLPFLDRYSTLYWLIAGITVAVTSALAWLNRTPLGTLWMALSQNEERLQYFGFRTDKLKALAFALSAFVAAIGGAIYAPQQGLVTPQTISVLLSAEFVVWAAVGGRTSPYGALLGAVGIGLLSSELRERFSVWEALVAVVFVIVVLRFPGGVWLAAVNAFRWAVCRVGLDRQAADAVPAPPIAAPEVGHRGRLSADDAPHDAVLTFVDVRVRANGVHILSGLDLAIESRGIHCVIGPNGAGKTSAFNTLTGRLSLTSGEIVLFGKRVATFHPVALARLGVGRKFQVPSVFPGLSVRDNLDVAVWADRCRPIDLLRPSLVRWTTAVRNMLEQEFPFLVDDAERRASELSQGQRQMLELAMSMIPEPALLLLDEPCAGLSPEETRRQIEVTIKMVALNRSTALVIEHDLSAVERMAERVHVLHQGRALSTGTLIEIQADAAVQAVYAGGRK